MKRLLNRFRTSGPAPLDGDSSSMFSTMYLERGVDSAVLATWTARAPAVKAEPFDRGRGIDLFQRLWSDDRHVAALQPGDLARMGDYLQFVSVPAGQEVIGQDELGDYLLIVLEGTLAVDRVQAWGGRARLAEARAGEMLGEMSLLDAGARFSACTTLSRCLLAVVDAPHLDQMVRDDPRLALALLAALSRRLSLRLRQVSARLSALLSRS